MGIIKNIPECATSPLREGVLRIVEAGIERVLPGNLVKESVGYDAAARELWINGTTFVIKGRLFIVGGGKASGAMAASLETVIGTGNVTAGVVIVKGSNHSEGDRGADDRGRSNIVLVAAGHPYPDERGVLGSKRMLALKHDYGINEDDTVLCLISGGGSSLMVLPEPWLSLEEKQKITRFLLACGADIHEINTVRKHLSAIKGGKLREHFRPARVVSLVISDVIGDDLDIIASGPTVHDFSTSADALRVLEKYDIASKISPEVIRHLKDDPPDDHAMQAHPWRKDRGARGDDFIIGTNRRALDAMSAKARGMGLHPVMVTSEQAGETGAVARSRARQIAGGTFDEFDTILLGGETTPSLPADHGKGGRNQHFAAATMAALKEFRKEWTAAFVGTDGSDFTADVAGAIVDHRSYGRAVAMGLDIDRHLEKYDSGTLLEKLGESLIKTGPTGTNVCDVMVYNILKK